MQVSTTTFQPIYEGVKQYVVPLFQRSYSWGKKEWNNLWEDLMDLYQEENPRMHFMGSIVTIPTQSVPEGVSKFLLIDGQQRVTTLYLLMLVISDQYNSRGEVKKYNEIRDTLLINTYKEGLDYYKLMPTQVDRDNVMQFVRTGKCESDSQISQAYTFFTNKLRQNIDLEKLQIILTKKLTVVSIVLDASDNPYLVFESLNYKGLPLSVADLIRNYIFMKVHVDNQEDVYQNMWKPMQENLNDSLPEFVRHYLMMNGDFVKTSDVYSLLKERIDTAGWKSFIESLSRFANFYSKLLDPQKESSIRVRKSLQIVKRLEISTAYPLLLNIYSDYERGAISEQEFIDSLYIIENFVVRRFVCSVPTNQLNKTFPQVYAQMKNARGDTYIARLQYVLQSKNYPKDYEFRNGIETAKLYGAGDRTTKTKIMLERIEESFNHKERGLYENLTIEHVMPQTLSPSWKEQLGDDHQRIHELFLNTMGNLTLTGYNSELSNKTFDEKRVLYKESHLELNKYFGSIESWNEDSITSRGAQLATRLSEIYPYFGGESMDDTTVDFTGKKPKGLLFFGERRNVDSWASVLDETLNIVSYLVPEKLEILSSEFPSFLGRDIHEFRRPKEIGDKYFYESNLNANAIYRLCRQIIGTIELDDEEWSVEVSENNI